MVIKLQEPTESGAEEPQPVETRQCLYHNVDGKMLIWWQPVMENAETDNDKQIIDKDIKYYMIYLKSIHDELFYCHGIEWKNEHWVNDRPNWNHDGTVYCKIKTVDKNGRCSDFTPIQELSVPTGSKSGVAISAYDAGAGAGKMFAIVENEDGVLEIQESVDSGVTWTIKGTLS